MTRRARGLAGDAHQDTRLQARVAATATPLPPRPGDQQTPRRAGPKNAVDPESGEPWAGVVAARPVWPRAGRAARRGAPIGVPSPPVDAAAAAVSPPRRAAAAAWALQSRQAAARWLATGRL